MRKSILLLSAGLISLSTFAQVPEDALRMSWFTPNGTARSQAIGGAIGALGGDISSNFVNPAGIGLFKTSEIVFSPGFKFITNDAGFRGTSATEKSNGFVLGTSGLVMGMSDRMNRNRNTAFSLAINRTADFNNKILYRGQNNFSSYSEAYASEIAESGLTLDQALNSNSISFPARMGLYTYLVDTLTTPGFGTEVVATPLRYAFQNDTAFMLNQENFIETSGGITELAITFAGGTRDKFYYGGSFGLPIVNFEKNSVLSETDASNNSNNDFQEAILRERFTSKGFGLNLKAGIIYKPVEKLRLGFAFHTPTIYALKDTYDGTLETDLEGYNGISTVNVKELNDGFLPEYEYDLSSPWRFIASGAYVINEVADVRKQKGFISADVEYVTYGSSRFRNAEESTIEDEAFFNAVNGVVKDIYKGTINAKVGGELKFNTIMARAGFSYYGSPYTDSELDGKRMFVSGGFGYRNKGFFIDLTYVHRITNDVNFPYRLSDKANTFADLRGTGGNVIGTVGIKF
ncbi:hypothetical protein MD537_18045 [Flavihumibacter sediminis]|nr:hypothetical protein [Flavihumibacter sediminis]